MLQDITQAYTQSKTELNCIVIYHLPAELKKKYLEDTVLCVVKPLYGLAEAGNHWFATNLDYHKEKLGMKISPYNAYLLITKDGGEIIWHSKLSDRRYSHVGTGAFMKKEETEIMDAKFKGKTQTILKIEASGDFNGYHMTIKAESIIVVQKNQVEKLILVDNKDNAKKQQYVV